jgi:hypothetical protein
VDEPAECPAWCVADHRPVAEGGEDERTRRHRSAIVDLPAIAPDGALELMIELHRVDGETTTWVYVGDGTDQRLELSVESAARLVAALATAIRPAAG